jgi:hypothetical protein
MDIGSVATSLSASNVSGSIGLSVLNSVLNLDQTVAAQLAASIGLGTRIDAYA